MSKPYETNKSPNHPSASPRLTNLEFRSTLEQFLIADGDCHVVVIGHVNCYGIQRARQLRIQRPNGRQPSIQCYDGDGGQICYIDDWLMPLADLLTQESALKLSDKEISSLNIHSQVKKLKDTIAKREGGLGTQGIVTIVGLLLDDTVPGTQPTRLIVQEIHRRKAQV